MTITRNDVLEAVRKDFAPEVAGRVLALLDTYGVVPWHRERERVQLAIVQLAQGDENRCRHLLETAKVDYRDVLHWRASGPLPADEGAALQEAARRLIERWGREG